MSVAKAGTRTYPPEVKIGITEKAKYEKMWAIDDYRVISPGEQSASVFLEQAKPPQDATCIDFGCGTGRGGLMIALMGQMIVTLVDFAENALDEDVKNATMTQPHRIKWVEADLAKPIPVVATYGYCTDVMEHIPPEQVDDVLDNVLASANHVFFQISTVDDVMGERIGHPLHLTVESYEWWAKKLRQRGAYVHWAHNEQDQVCLFYVSSWVPHDKIEVEGKLNTTDELIRSQIEENVKNEAGQFVHPHPMQEQEIMLICGGPSLNDYTDEIIRLRAQGMPMVTTNGTYNWAIQNGMTPSMQLIIDAREFNKRFVQPIVDDCKYMLASQCHPSLFEDLPEDRTYMFHCAISDDISEFLDESYEIWFPIPGGSTVTLRGLCLLRMLGFHKIHMYGFDSCYREDEHHAYLQPENDYKNRPIPVSVGGRAFLCDPWMFTQATEWMQMVGKFGDEFDLNVKGDGLIAHIIKTGANLERLEGNEE